MKMKIIDIIEDLSIYPRNQVSAAHVASIVDSLSMGDPVPPIVVEKKTHRIIDGFHRYRAHKKLKLERIEVIERSYKNEGAVFADALRLNRQHGLPFDSYDLRRAVQRLQEYGLKLGEISEVVRVPRGRIEQFVGEFGKGPQGPVVIKKGLMTELKGAAMTSQQQHANERYGGLQPTFYVNQLKDILTAGIVPKSPAFSEGMDQLCELWMTIRKKSVA